MTAGVSLSQLAGFFTAFRYRKSLKFLFYFVKAFHGSSFPDLLG
jgi:hypothetical protein